MKTSSVFLCGNFRLLSGLLMSDMLTLALTEKGDMTSDADAPYQIIIGEPLGLTCNPPNIDQDKSKVEWIKDGEDDNILVSDDQYKVDNDNRTILIKSAEPDDAGTYECRTTSAQPLTKHFSAFFFKLEELPKTTCAEQGGNITLTCLAEGQPIPTVQWLKDGQKLNDSKYAYKSNEHYISNAVLSFTNVHGDDNGIYTCQVFSDMGIENTTTNINVKSSCGSSSLDPGYVIITVILILIVIGICFAIFYCIRNPECFQTAYCYIMNIFHKHKHNSKTLSYNNIHQSTSEEEKGIGNV